MAIGVPDAAVAGGAVAGGALGRSDPGWTIGLDIGGSKVLGVLLDPAGAVRGTTRLTTRLGTEGVVSSGAEVVRELCAAADRSVGTLEGVGVGVPGLVDPTTGVVSHAVNLRLPGQDVPLGPMLSEVLDGVPVAVENDLNSAALGAAKVLGLRGDLAFLALGTGVAAGLLLDGRLRRGLVGAAGEIGHVPYRLDGPQCPCGQRGCLELYASGSALDAAWPSRTGRPAPAEVFAAAGAGDPHAVAVRDAFTAAVAHAVRLVVLTCDVEHVLLGGGVAEIGAPLLEAVGTALREQAHGSSFLRSLSIADRVAVVPRDLLVAPIGAALAVRVRSDDPTIVEAVAWRS